MKEHKGVSTFPLIDRLPKKVRKPIYGAIASVGLGGVAAFGAVCEGNTQEEPQFPPEAFSQSIDPSDYDSSRPFRYPVPVDLRMQIQQGWSYEDSVNSHDGIDYVFGEYDDPSSWRSFPVLAVYEGQACANPKRKIGNAVLIRHEINGEVYHSYYGHLKEIKDSIPQCEQEGGWNTVTKRVETGEGLGKAGSSGASDEDWTHLHFGVIGPEGDYVDPYDVYAKRAEYPDVLHQNGNVCGERTLFANCPTESQDVKVGAATYAVPTKTPQATSTPRPVETPTPVVVSTPVVSEVELSRDQLIQIKMEEAEGKMASFMGFMLSGQEADLRNALALQTPLDLQNQFQQEFNPNYYKLMTIAELAQCSQEMRDGGLSILDYKIIRRPRVEAVPNEEQPDNYAVSVAFNFRNWNYSTDRRNATSKVYNHEGFRHSLVFEDIDGELYVNQVDICKASDTEIKYTR